MTARAAVLLAALALSAFPAQEKLWWRSVTPAQTQPVSCSLAKDEQELARIVSPLGWDKDGFPNLDWAGHYAVVIAPNAFHRGYHLGFLEQRKQDRVLEFRWGWVTPNSTDSRQGGSVTVGGAKEGKEGIVIAFPKDDLTGRTVSCPEVP